MVPDSARNWLVDDICSMKDGSCDAFGSFLFISGPFEIVEVVLFELS